MQSNRPSEAPNHMVEQVNHMLDINRTFQWNYMHVQIFSTEDDNVEERNKVLKCQHSKRTVEYHHLEKQGILKIGKTL